MEPEASGRTPAASGEPASFEDQVDLRQLFEVLWSGRWWIAGVAALAIVLGVLYALAARPVYQADALLRIEDKNSTLAGMDALEKITGGTPETAAQIRIIQSRSVLGATVDRLNLTVHAEPARMPVLYTLFADRGADEPTPPRLGLDSYDWGGSRIHMGRMSVPRALRGQPFTLVALGEGRYRLDGPEGATVLEGRVGAVESAQLEDGEVTLFVEDLVARPGTAFSLTANTRLGTIDALRQRLSVSEQGEDTGVVQMRLEGEDRTRIRHTLATIADVYLRQNTERRSAEARESLKFVEGQLPKLKDQVEQAEGKLADYQQSQETVDLSVETEKLLGQLVDLDEKISQLQTKRAEASRTYGPQHPVIEAIDAQLNTLRKEKKQLDQRVGTLPDKQREMLSLKRELKVNTEVYTQMLNSAQELRVAKAGAVGNVRIVDHAAVAGKPIAPRKGLILVLSAFLGGFGGCALVLGRRFFQRGVETPDELEQRTGLSVYAVVPHCRELLRAERRFERGSRDTAPLLTVDAPEDPATEAVRSLRTSLHFGLRDPGHRVVAVTSPGPAAGKSTVAVNLALLLAEIGQSVVVIDGDMRRGHLGRYIGDGRSRQGLADVLAGTVAWSDAVHPLDNNERAVLITRGTTPPNPSELLLSERYGALIEELRAAYDWVIVDAPPIMAVTDAAIIAHEASAVFVVARSARDEANEVTDSVRRLEHGGARVTGLILNDYGARQVGRTYQAYYYRYDYSRKADKA